MRKINSHYIKEFFMYFQSNKVNYRLYQATHIKKEKASNQIYSYFCMDWIPNLDWQQIGFGQATHCVFIVRVCVYVDCLIELKVKRGHDFNSNLIYSSFVSQWNAFRKNKRKQWVQQSNSSSSFRIIRI